MDSTKQEIYQLVSQLKLLEDLSEENAYKTLKTDNSHIAIQLVEANEFFTTARLISFLEAESQAELDYEIEIRVWRNNIAEGVSLIRPSLGIDKQAYRRRSGLELPRKINQAEINSFLSAKLQSLQS